VKDKGVSLQYLALCWLYIKYRGSYVVLSLFLKLFYCKFIFIPVKCLPCDTVYSQYVLLQALMDSNLPRLQLELYKEIKKVGFVLSCSFAVWYSVSVLVYWNVALV